MCTIFLKVYFLFFYIVIIKEQNAIRPPSQACPNQCAPTCAPICSGTCCALTRKSTLKH